MQRTAGDTRKKIIDIGEQLLLRQGFNAFSYADIAASLGVKNAAIHYHYPAKCDLGIAIIERARQRFARWSAARKTALMSDWERLDDFFRLYSHYIATSGSVCLCGALETDFATLPPAMQEEARALANDLLDWVEQFLHEGRDKGTFAFPGTPRDQAIVILAVMQGGLQMIQAMDQSVFETAIGQVRKLLEP
ncbi:TetR/AcrR family transcriptional regulator [bacterium]|nr:TetR/AcrR family transcriptional regulator [bacterium]